MHIGDGGSRLNLEAAFRKSNVLTEVHFHINGNLLLFLLNTTFRLTLSPLHNSLRHTIICEQRFGIQCRSGRWTRLNTHLKMRVPIILF